MTNLAERQEYVQINETPKTTEKFVSPEVSDGDGEVVNRFFHRYKELTEEQKDECKKTFNNLLYEEGFNFNNAEITEKDSQYVSTLENVMKNFPNVSEVENEALKKMATSSLEKSINENGELSKIVDGNQYEK